MKEGSVKNGPSRLKVVMLASAFAGIVLSLGRGPATNATSTAALQKLDGHNTTHLDYVDISRQHVRRPYSVILEEIKEENAWKNTLVLFWMPDAWRSALPICVQTWLRNLIATNLIFYGVGGAWSYYIYWVFGFRLFKSEEIPAFRDVSEQMKVAFFAIPLYAVLPTINEWVVENGYTLAYSRISDVGLLKYIAYFVLYMTSVEFCVYWQHRNLHDIKWGYRVLHTIHHKYNKEHSMSPFAGLAFHPLDGILQALPYCWTLMYVPMHFLTHELLLFLTGIWTLNIHDNLHGDVAPILGAKFHTIHHTAYNFNYGHYTTLMDEWYGTLLDPKDYDSWLKDRSSRTFREKKLKSELKEDSEASQKVVALEARSVLS